MFEKALTGSRGYWTWLAALVIVAAIGAAAWFVQLETGLSVTGLGRDVSWGLYIAQFTFLVGVAASAVTVVLPYYLHDCAAFARVTILGESLAIAAVVTCGLFILVDMGQPARVLNVIRYASPTSLMFWDMLSLGGYLVINAVVAWVSLSSERQDTPVPGWVKLLILLSIPWAVSIHTITAFLYAGLPGRPFWMTALLAPRFLASAFAAGPSLLILLALLLRRAARFDVGRDALGTLSMIVTYATIANVFFVAMELFTVFYGGIPEHEEHFRYLFLGLEGHRTLVPWMWTSAALTGGGLALLMAQKVGGRKESGVRDTRLGIAAAAIFAGLWIDKGLGLIVGGFTPNPFGEVSDYWPTAVEVLVSAGIWSVGALLVTVFYKIIVGVRAENGTLAVDSR